MGNWLSRVFGSGDVAPSARRTTGGIEERRPPVAPDAHRPERETQTQTLTDAQIAFLVGLNDPPTSKPLDDLPQDDRTFIAGIQRRLRTRELELPVLPEMAIRLSRMFREGAAVTEFVTLIGRDAALSVEVLKAANSAFYVGAAALTSLQDAIIRIGLNRLQSVLMLAHMRGKVLKGGAFTMEADLLLEMALPLGHLASKVASGRLVQPEMCFMRGALMHVEHLVILGSVSAVARDLKRAIAPSTEALHQAFGRFAPGIREAVAHEWNLTELLVGGQGEMSMAEEYSLLRRVLICRWLQLPMTADVSRFDGLPAAVAGVVPRVAVHAEAGAVAQAPLDCAN